MEKCQCEASVIDEGLCATCGLPSRTTALPGAPNCYLCKGSVNVVHCDMCGKGYHYQPHCRLHSGVHPLYHANFSSGGPICPDCVWTLCNSHRADPIDDHSKNITIEKQLQLAANPEAAAGSDYIPNSRNKLRSLFRLIEGNPSCSKSSCPQHLIATLEMAIRQGMIFVDPHDRLCRGPTGPS